MARLCLFLVVCLAGIAFVNAISHVGQRLYGDQLLLSELVKINAATGQARLQRSFPGKIITRIELKPILSITESLFDLKIDDGGVYANFVDLEVKFLNAINVPMWVRIYGMPVVSGVVLDNDSNQIQK